MGELCGYGQSSHLGVAGHTFASSAYRYLLFLISYPNVATAIIQFSSINHCSSDQVVSMEAINKPNGEQEYCWQQMGRRSFL